MGYGKYIAKCECQSNDSTSYKTSDTILHNNTVHLLMTLEIASKVNQEECY